MNNWRAFCLEDREGRDSASGGVGRGRVMVSPVVMATVDVQARSRDLISLSHVMSRLPHGDSAAAPRPFRVLTATITVSQGLQLQLYLWMVMPVFISGRTLSTFLCAIWLLR